MIRRTILPVISVIIILWGMLPGYGQNRIGDWQSFTNMMDVYGIHAVGDSIYAATGGGLLVYDIQSEQFAQITNIRDLTHTDFRDILFDHNDRLWLAAGSPRGDVNIWEPGSGLHQVIPLDQTSTIALTELTLHENSVFGAAIRNLEPTVIHYTRLENGEYDFKDFYNQFPVVITDILDIAVYRDQVYLATPEGVIRSDPLDEDPNLKADTSWEMFTFDTAPHDISAFLTEQDQLYLADTLKVYRYDGNTVNLLEGEDFPGQTHAMRMVGERLLVGTSRGLYRRDQEEWQLLGGREIPVRAMTESEDGTLWIGSGGYGIATWNGAEGVWQFRQPNCPFANQFSAMTVSPDGLLIAANTRGVAIYDGNRWHNVLNYNKMPAQDRGLVDLLAVDNGESYWSADTIRARAARPYNAVIRGQDQLFVSHEGSGVLQLNIRDYSEYQDYDTTNAHLTGSAGIGTGGPNFIVTRDVAVDNEGVIWIANAFPSNGNALAAISPDGAWMHFNLQASGVGLALNHLPREIAVDNQNRIWIGSGQKESDPQSRGGIGMLDYAGTLFDTSDDQWFWFNQSHGLSGMHILSLSITSDNELFVVSTGERRVQSYRIPQGINSSTEVRFSTDQTELFLSNFSISKSYVDVRDNTWFIEEANGVKMRKSNGELLNGAEGYNTGNTPLINDNVYTVTSNPKTGVVYFATEFGISAVTTPYAAETQNFSEIYTFPSPYYVPNTQAMVIDQLPDESEVKVMTLNGEVIRTLTAADNEVRNRQAFWNGRDEQGNLVGSGVYFLYCYTQDGQVETTKALVIRK